MTGITNTQAFQSRRLPGADFSLGQGRFLLEKGAHAIGSDFGGRVQPAKEADPAIPARQDMLQKSADQFVRFQFEELC